MSDTEDRLWVDGCAAALAGLPGIGPAALLNLLRRHRPEEAWRRVLAGEERRPDPRRPGRQGRLSAGERPRPDPERGQGGLSAGDGRRPDPAWGEGPGRLSAGDEPDPRQGGARGGGPVEGVPRSGASGRRSSWSDEAASIDPEQLGRRLHDSGIGVTCLGQPDYPAALRHDPEPPAVLFWMGDLAVLERPCVAIIGTRQCTSYGREVATQLGQDLAEAGVCVVSGLALGIDGAAHAGALGARPSGAGPVGVAASGVDRPYPSRHAALWARVATAGAMLSETAPGKAAEPWRFPARNRIIAGLCRAVVVVESHAGGGSMLTVAAAANRGIDILAVPGPVTSPSSVGTNQLLFEGVAPARHAGDVLAAIGDLRPWPPLRDGGGAAGGRAGGLDPASRRVLEAVEWTPTSTSVLVERTGLAFGPLSTVLVRLDSLGLVRGDGGWWERAGR